MKDVKSGIDYAAISRPKEKRTASAKPAEPVASKAPKIEPTPLKAAYTKGTVVKCASLNIRDLPNIEGKVVTVVPAGTVLSIFGEAGNYYSVSVDGTDFQGVYAMKYYVEPVVGK